MAWKYSTSAVAGAFVIPPMTPAMKPAGAESQRSQCGGTRGVRPVAFSATKQSTKTPRIRVAAQGDRTTSARVPSTTPSAPAASSTAKRRTVASGVPRRANWMPSITMLGRIRTNPAVWTSTTRLSRGVPRAGKPKPIAPLTKAATSTTAAIRAATTAPSIT
jgi:hypothetical protein